MGLAYGTEEVDFSSIQSFDLNPAQINFRGATVTNQSLVIYCAFLRST